KTIDQIHTPLLQNKNEVFNKQAISLYHRLNKKRAVEAVTDICINQDFLLVGMSKGGNINECEEEIGLIGKGPENCIGRKAKWYTLLERELLKEDGSREVRKEFLAEPVNKLAIKVKLRPVLEDQRKKEWILVARENNQWDIRRIIGKEQETVLTEHWVQELQDAAIETIVERCGSCNRNKLEKKQSCEKQIERREIVRVLPTRPYSNGKKKLDLNIGAILRWGKRKKMKNKVNLELPQRLEEVQELGIEVIKNQKLSLALEELIIRKYRKNRSENKESLVFFTDGSL
ncbi:4059_t:CDS:2, partial [Gigaspora rosea]